MPSEGTVAKEDLDRVLESAGGERFTVRQLRERVSVLEPGVVLMEEINRGTPETLLVITAAIEELAADMDAYGIVLDLTDSEGSTTSEYRKFIPKHFTELHTRSNGRLKLVAVAFVGSQVARVASKFLIGRMTSVPMAIERDRDNAVRAVRKAIASDK
jgi:hypothetical protein